MQEKGGKKAIKKAIKKEAALRAAPTSEKLAIFVKKEIALVFFTKVIKTNMPKFVQQFVVTLF